MTDYIDIHTHGHTSAATAVRNHRLGVEQTASATVISAGVHPWDAELLLPQFKELIKTLESAKCVAIGEIGLDKACSSAWAAQQKFFNTQLEVAARRNLPVVIHCVRAQAEIIAQLAHHPHLPAVIFHGFIGSPEQAHALLSRGYFISFGFNALKSPKTIEAIKACPTEQLLLESDTSTTDIALLYQAVADIKGLTTDTLLEQITNNYNRIFQ